MNGYVPSIRAVGITHRLLVRQLVTKGRVAALAGVGAIVSVLVVVVSRRSDPRIEPEAALRFGTELVAYLGFTVLAPIVALVFASAAFGDLKEDATLVYLWLRPMDRWPMVVGGFLAAATVSLPLTLVPLTVAAVVADVGVELVWATVLACLVGNVAYCAVFMLLGLLTKNAVVWGIGYVLIWEGLIAGVSSLGARLALRGYTSSILSDRTGVELHLGELSWSAAVVVPALVVVAASVLSTLRLRSMDVA